MFFGLGSVYVFWLCLWLWLFCICAGLAFGSLPENGVTVAEQESEQQLCNSISLEHVCVGLILKEIKQKSKLKPPNTHTYIHRATSMEWCGLKCSQETRPTSIAT